MPKPKIAGFAIFSLLTSLSVFAGQIEIGGANGLTGAYLGVGGSQACTGSTIVQAGFSGCEAASLNGAAQGSYSSGLWSGSLATGPSGEPSGLQLTDSHNNITYSMINNGSTTCEATNDGGCNFWSIDNQRSMTIPIGVFGVSLAHIMLNDAWGLTGAQNTTVTLDFNSKSDGSGTVTAVPFLLINGTDIRSATQCAGSGISASCPSNIAKTVSSPNNTQVWSVSYSDNFNSSSVYYHTFGTLALDALAFTVPLAHRNLWLADIKVSNFSSANVVAGNNISRTALSAITLETPGAVSSTPEPATAGLGLGCIALIGYFGKRKLRRNSIV